MNVLAKLEKQQKLRHIPLNEGGTTARVNKANTRMYRSGKDLRGKIVNHEQTIMTKESEMKTTKESCRAHFEEKLTYIQKPTIRAMVEKVAVNVVVMAIVDGITVTVCTFGDKWKKYNDGKISLGKLVKFVAKETVIATSKGAGVAFAFEGLDMWVQYATASGAAYAGALTFASTVAGPIAVAGMLIKKSHDIIKQWNAGDITKAEMAKQFVRFIIGNVLLKIGGMYLFGAVIGGPIGLLVGAGLAIAVGVGDYFLGDKIWSKLIKEDPEEELVLMERKINALSEDVLHSAYDLLDLTEYSTRKEIKQKYRVAILKYHPDKGGSAGIFNAVQAAYKFICNARHFDFDQ